MAVARYQTWWYVMANVKVDSSLFQLLTKWRSSPPQGWYKSTTSLLKRQYFIIHVRNYDAQRPPFWSPASHIMLLDNDEQRRSCLSLLQPQRFLYDRCSRRFLAQHDGWVTESIDHTMGYILIHPTISTWTLLTSILFRDQWTVTRSLYHSQRWRSYHRKR